jgi:hypothetical protein
MSRTRMACAHTAPTLPYSTPSLKNVATFQAPPVTSPPTARATAPPALAAGAAWVASLLVRAHLAEPLVIAQAVIRTSPSSMTSGHPATAALYRRPLPMVRHAGPAARRRAVACAHQAWHALVSPANAAPLARMHAAPTATHTTACAPHAAQGLPLSAAPASQRARHSPSVLNVWPMPTVRAAFARVPIILG